MLILEKSHLEAVVHHALETYPRECCGILLGDSRSGQWSVEQVQRANNLAAGHVRDRYVMDPMDRLRAETQARSRQLSIVGFYHSHPDHDVYFSKTDLEHSEELLLGEPWLPPTYAYLVLSIEKGQPRGYGAFVVRGGKSEQIQVKIE